MIMRNFVQNLFRVNPKLMRNFMQKKSCKNAKHLLKRIYCFVETLAMSLIFLGTIFNILNSVDVTG